MNRIAKAIVAAFVSAVSIMPASAADLLLSYRFMASGKTVSVHLTGDLGADANTFVVTGFDSFAVDGTPASVGPLFDSADRAYGGTGTANQVPTITLDGSYLDFIIDNGVQGGVQGKFVLSVGDQVAGAYAAQTGYAGGAAGTLPQFGGSAVGFEDFHIANYTAQLLGAVPEVGTGLMLIGGMGMIGVALRRRRVGAIVRI